MPMSGYLPQWRVGKAFMPKAEDRRYGDEQAAIETAKIMSDALGWYEAIAVWNDEDDIVHLFICGQQFKAI